MNCDVIKLEIKRSKNRDQLKKAKQLFSDLNKLCHQKNEFGSQLTDIEGKNVNRLGYVALIF